MRGRGRARQRFQWRIQRGLDGRAYKHCARKRVMGCHGLIEPLDMNGTFLVQCRIVR